MSITKKDFCIHYIEEQSIDELQQLQEIIKEKIQQIMEEKRQPLLVIRGAYGTYATAATGDVREIADKFISMLPEFIKNRERMYLELDFKPKSYAQEIINHFNS